MIGNKPSIYNAQSVYNQGGVKEGEFISYNAQDLPVTYRQVNYIINNNNHVNKNFRIPVTVQASNADYIELEIATKTRIDDSYAIFKAVATNNAVRLSCYYSPIYRGVTQYFVLEIGGVATVVNNKPYKARNDVVFFAPYAYINNEQYNCNGTIYNDIAYVNWGIPQQPQKNYLKFGKVKIIDKVTMQKKLNAIPCIDPDGLIGFFDTVSQTFTTLFEGDNNLLLTE